MKHKQTSCHPDKAQYLIGEDVHILLREYGAATAGIKVGLFSLHHSVPCVFDAVIKDGVLDIQLHTPAPGNYGVEIQGAGFYAGTAFDVVQNYSDITRYGFLTDFSTDDTDTADIENMKNLHLNAVQFYDWMYRHNQLLPAPGQYTDDTHRYYVDPLDKLTSVEAIQNKIDACRKNGMRPFAYGAIYAAAEAFYRQHREWALYTMDGAPLTFGDGWLYYMDITSPWRDHIIDQYGNAAEKLSFMGIHMDTYGFPKRAWNAKGESVELREHFSALINDAQKRMASIDPHNGVIFNAVNNWPVEHVAKSGQDAVYIEVWPPNERYYDLYRLIREGRYFSGKPVILAAYMSPFKDAFTDDEIAGAEWGFLLTNAAINASGGTQLALGENKCILCEAYYTRHATLRECFLPAVRRYADFLVRYADILYADTGIDISMTGANGINDELKFSADGVLFSSDAKDGTVWTIARETPKRITIQMLNLCGNDTKWNAPKKKPALIDGIKIKMRLDRMVSGIYAASPDNDTSLSAVSLDYSFENTKEGRVYTVESPPLFIWNSMWVEIDNVPGIL